MANRRQLKKRINYITGELFCECLVHSLYVPGADKEKADALMTDILNLQNDFISRVCHTEKGSEKQFYRKLHADFGKRVDEILEAIGKLKAE